MNNANFMETHGQKTQKEYCKTLKYTYLQRKQQNTKQSVHIQFTCPTFFKCETFAKFCNITVKVDVTDIEAVDKTAENRPTNTLTCPTFFNVQQGGTVAWHTPLQPKPS